MRRGRLLLFGVVVALVATFFLLDVDQYLSLDHFRARQAAIESYRAAHPFQTASLFFLAYVAVTGLSVPGAVILTLAAGAIFGLWWGTLIVSFAASVGATLAFLASRFLLHDAVQRRFGDRLRAINAGVAKDGAFYLFGLRLVPVFPYFVINLVMALTPLRAPTFYWVSQLGMLPATLVYVNAGREIGRIESLGGILSPGVLASLTLLAIFPLLARRAMTWAKARKTYARWPRPARFDRNLVVIGAGSAGLVSAYLAAAVKAKVTLIERERMGGDCLNTGCVPSKALVRTTRFLADVRRARELGVRAASADADFAEVMERVQRVVRSVAPHDSVERYTGLGVEVLAGEARLVSPWAVEVRGREGTRTLTTRGVVIATGGRPAVPDLPGIDDVGYLTSDSVWDLRALPPRLLVLGGGPVGCELAQCFARLGSRVTQVQRGPRLLPKEDPEIAAMVMERFCAEGIDLRVGHAPLRFEREGEAGVLVCLHDGAEVRIPFDRLLVATGRRATTAGLGLDVLGIGVRADGTVETDEYLRTALPNVYAAGDVAGPYQFTHTASHQAWYASVNALFGQLRRFRVDYSAIPWCTFTDPEVARVGLSEQEARARGVAYEVTTLALDDLDRAIADEAAHGLVKVLTVPGKGRILGATIVGQHAGDLLTEFTLAMRHGLGLDKILGTIHVYPTYSEAAKYAAGAWRRAHAPARLLRVAERYHAWRRDRTIQPIHRGQTP